ncbi:DUF4350 domain-containing protein [Mangrovivirga cuniculi]|uniref:DUF4350 domain-containing protein n=1 Tax=Mangrovivirga cuniculi TaxID=2715131 RepID=A0A4D7JK60_9BACT|nr:DUF4350 domain-containing protein [Mangrovivirga cuniculi]QCK15343.1 hypothetical protein DCC35_11595 [Mangrovivirga cuniculi]
MRDNLVNIIIAVFIGLVALLFVINALNDNYHWSENYYWEGENPYDLKIYKDWLETLDDKTVDFIDVRNAERSFDSTSAYIIVGNHLAESNKQLPKFFDAVNNGATALIATYTNPSDILDSLEAELGYELYYFSNETLKRFTISNENYSEIFVKYNQYGDPLITSEVRVLQDYNIDHLTPLLYIDEGPIAFEVSYGNGKLIFINTPIVFSNYYLSNRKFQTAKFLTKRLEGEKIYLDRYFTNPYKNEEYIDDDQMGSNPLSFVLSDKHLSTAWYVFLATALIYLFYVSKRKQRVIPVIPDKENRTLNHVKLVGELYYQKADSYVIFQKLYKVFFEHIRSRYNLNTSKIDDNLIKKLNMKSGVEIELIQTIVQKIENLNYKKSVSDKELIDIYNLIQTFYKKEL